MPILKLPGNPSRAQLVQTINKLVDAHNSDEIATLYAIQGVNRMLVGYQKDGWGTGKDFGIKISEPNIDVVTAIDADLLFKLAY